MQYVYIQRDSFVDELTKCLHLHTLPTLAPIIIEYGRDLTAEEILLEIFQSWIAQTLILDSEVEPHPWNNYRHDHLLRGHPLPVDYDECAATQHARIYMTLKDDFKVAVWYERYDKTRLPNGDTKLTLQYQGRNPELCDFKELLPFGKVVSISNTWLCESEHRYFGPVFNLRMTQLFAEFLSNNG